MSSLEIEPGVHPVQLEASNAIFEKINNGDLDAHMWNGSVAGRMSSYEPTIIGIDSVEPSRADTPQAVGTDYKKHLWAWLPARPSELNDRAEVFVVAGDNTHYHPEPNDGKNAGLMFLTAGTLAAAGYKAGSMLDSAGEEAEPSKKQIYDQDRENTPEKSSLRIHSRRQFLAGMGAAAGLAILQMPNIAASLPKIGERAFREIEEETSKINLSRRANIDGIFDFVDGRTALMIAKMNDTFKRPLFAGYKNVGSLVVGSGHLAKAEELKRDPISRDEYIRRHAHLVIEKAREDEEYFTDRSTPHDRAADMLATNGRVEIFRVTEPDEKRAKADPTGEISRSIELVDWFDSASVGQSTSGILEVQR